MHTNTYFRQSWFSGARLGAGATKLALGHKVQLSHPPMKPVPTLHRPPGEVEAKLMSGAEEQFPFIIEWLVKH